MRKQSNQKEYQSPWGSDKPRESEVRYLRSVKPLPAREMAKKLTEKHGRDNALRIVEPMTSSDLYWSEVKRALK